MRSLVGGESATSVTSSRARSGRARRAVAATTPPTPRAGANVAEFGAALGTAAGMDPSSSHAPVWPDDDPGPTGTTFDGRPLPSIVAAVATAALLESSAS